jgi:hypothetical protein
MKFLHKTPDSLTAFLGLTYPKDRIAARQALSDIQRNFCAYSERYLKPLDSVDVEHFDPRLKNSASDNIYNWHAVIHWLNMRKSNRIEDFEPLPDLRTWTADRISYRNGFFECDATDVETSNLIDFLGVNRKEAYDERAKQVARIRRIMEMIGSEELIEFLAESPDDLSFPTAIATELGLPVDDLIARSFDAPQ